MKEMEQSLSDHTWIKIGGEAEIILPESQSELVDALDKLHRENQTFRILGNGSNVLATDDPLDYPIVKTTQACTQFSIDGNNVKVGSSIKLPQFARQVVENDLGGIEYLFSVPGTVGGAIFMNAGRGKGVKGTISDYLDSVVVHTGETVREIPKDELSFSHRYSTFQEHEDWVILNASFIFPSQDKEIGKEKLEERMSHIKGLERGQPNIGTIFKDGAVLPTKGLRIGDAKYCQNNRICNMGNASYREVMLLIKIVVYLQKITPFAPIPELEIRIFD